MGRPSKADELIRDRCERVPAGMLAIDDLVQEVYRDASMNRELRVKLLYSLRNIEKEVGIFADRARALGLNPTRY